MASPPRYNPLVTSAEVELFRDRNPIGLLETGGAREDEPEPIDVSEIDAATLRETLLAAIGIAHRAAVAGKFGSREAQTLESVLDLTRDFPLLARAIDDMQAHGSLARTAQADRTPEVVSTSETVRVLRALKSLKSNKAG